jgi:hypothetical protein
MSSTCIISIIPSSTEAAVRLTSQHNNHQSENITFTCYKKDSCIKGHNTKMTYPIRTTFVGLIGGLMDVYFTHTNGKRLNLSFFL